MSVFVFQLNYELTKNQFMNGEYLKEKKKKNELILDKNNNSIENETNIVRMFRFSSSNEQDIKDRFLENIEPTLKWCRQFESKMNLPKSDVSYTYSSDDNSFYKDHSFESREHHYKLPTKENASF